ncbi:NADH:ubiquinone oxidoreductase [Malassezia caprae]|uniref:NADH:ubiquinone oxidoreductase n=1 Tax=Malassezia caprae TaxID=1381934 RepID=A0AAF0E5L3_9BASI|nr:NADH:ubiquinone oxidoreductase [Malassezia caprae]
MTDAPPSFANATEEARYWREQVEQMRSALQDAETGLQDFMESSKELEAEMEADMTAAHARADALAAENERLRADVDEWRQKHQASLTEHTTTMADLHKELSSLRETHAMYKAKLRDMELDNDALENAERDMELRYNKVMERTALLEMELEAKSRIEADNQRLKDEVRELHEELDAVQRHNTKAAAPLDAPAAPLASADDELTLDDLVVRRRPAAAPPHTLEHLREHMQQLQQRLQRAQALPTADKSQRRWQRSSLPRPRSSLGASGVPPSPAWRAPTPGYTGSPHRPETPGELRKSKSSLPVPTGGLSHSTSRSARPASRLASEVQSPVGPTPFEFMEFDPAASPIAATRQATLARRRSLGPSGLPHPSARPRPSSALRERPSPTKPRAGSPVLSPTKRTAPARPWR